MITEKLNLVILKILVDGKKSEGLELIINP